MLTYLKFYYAIIGIGIISNNNIKARTVCYPCFYIYEIRIKAAVI